MIGLIKGVVEELGERDEKGIEGLESMEEELLLFVVVKELIVGRIEERNFEVKSAVVESSLK